MGLPVYLAVLGGIILAIIGYSFFRNSDAAQQWRLQRKSAAWPWARITVESGDIDGESEGERDLPSWELEVEYSYTVEGQRYSGTYTSTFASKSEAEDLLKSLRELPPPARYQPGKPEVSVLDPYRDAGLGL